MDRLIYTAMTGASAAAAQQSVLANNMANVNTNGFRAELSAYRAVPVRGDGSTTRVFALEATSGASDAPGPAMRTGRNLDVMPAGANWFAVQGTDGTEAYTRNGSFEITATGELQTTSGLSVLSDGGTPINVPQNAAVTIGNDGTISATIGSQPSTTIGRLKLATPTADDPLKRSADGLFRTTSGDPLPQDGTAKVMVGVLEGSNVNAIETMVGMIQTARQFEAQMQLIQSAESNDRSASQLFSVAG